MKTHIHAFIDEIQQHEELYDKGHDLYMDIRRKDAIWRSLSAKYRINAKLKWAAIRDRYVREVNRIRSASNSTVKVETAWRLFPALNFLGSHIKPRKAKLNLMIEGEEVLFDYPQFEMVSPSAIKTSNSPPPDHREQKRTHRVDDAEEEDEQEEDNVSALLVSTLKQLSKKIRTVDTEEDEDWHFLQSIRCKMQRMNEDEKFNFKMCILREARDAEHRTEVKQ